MFKEKGEVEGKGEGVGGGVVIVAIFSGTVGLIQATPS